MGYVDLNEGRLLRSKVAPRIGSNLAISSLVVRPPSPEKCKFDSPAAQAMRADNLAQAACRQPTHELVQFQRAIIVPRGRKVASP